MATAVTVTPAHSALVRASSRLVDRLAQLEARIATGDENAWPELYQATVALAAVAPALTPGAGGRLVTTAELAGGDGRLAPHHENEGLHGHP